MLSSTANWHSSFAKGMAMLHRKTTTATPRICELYRPTTPLQTVSSEVWPSRCSCMIGKKLAGTKSSNAVSTRARLRLTTLCRWA
ncbi:hypothetical protein D3C80_1839370 [compost metagenome]